MLGVFREDQKTREEFLNLVNSKWDLRNNDNDDDDVDALDLVRGPLSGGQELIYQGYPEIV